MAHSPSDSAGLTVDFLACAGCRAVLRESGDSLICSHCGATSETEHGIPLLLATSAAGDDVGRVQVHYDHVAHEYDQVFVEHVSRHYLEKRLGIVRSLLRAGKLLDVGCGTGALGAFLASNGYQVYGVDVSPGMLAEAV